MNSLPSAFDSHGPLGQAWLQVWSDATADYATIGPLSEMALSTTPAHIRSTPNGGCSVGELATQHVPSLTAQLHTPRTLWAWQMLYGLTVHNHTTGTPTTHTSTVVVGQLAGDQAYAGLLPHAHDGGLAAVASVSDAITGTPYALGTDYSLALWGGLTAIVSVAGGALVRGAQVEVQYDATPTLTADLTTGGFDCRAARRFRVVEGLHINTPIDCQNATLGVVFDVADVTSPIALSWGGGLDAAPINIEITTRPGTPWHLAWAAHPDAS